jgi:hypothetical protein
VEEGDLGWWGKGEVKSEKGKGKEKRGKRISNIEQGISNDEVRIGLKDVWIPDYDIRGLAGMRDSGAL